MNIKKNIDVLDSTNVILMQVSTLMFKKLVGNLLHVFEINLEPLLWLDLPGQGLHFGVREGEAMGLIQA